jgi:membrane protein YdbS with pleckstrin-like domain
MESSPTPDLHVASPADPAPSPPSGLADPGTIADGIDYQLDPRWILLQKRTGWISAVAYSLLWLAIGWTTVNVADLSAGSTRALLALWAAASVAHGWWKQRRPEIAYRHAAYRVDPRGIEIRRGIFFRSVINVPRSRVQHTDVSQGPFERRFGLGTLTIHTAGVSHAMVALAGLEHARALRIRDYLLPRERSDVV